MSQVFGDTSFFVALISRRDLHHGAAERLGIEFRGRVVTTRWILLEVGNFFAASRWRSTATQFIDSWLDDPQTRIEAATVQSFDAGWQLYRQRSDKSWSLTDCISVNVMRDLGLRQALTSDHHFEQAGFEILLK